MRAALAIAVGLLGAPALADDTSLIAFMGGQGCTFGEGSRAAAIATGHDASAIDTLIATTLADGRAQQQGAYTVLNAATCTIRLPDITSAYTVTSPEVIAMTSAIDAYVGREGLDDEPGCFLNDPSEAFDALNGGARGAGFNDYITFLGAAIISGDVRFYAPDPLRTPVSSQVVTGACAELANIDAIRRSHTILESSFGEYIRLSGAENPCTGAGFGMAALDYTYRAQGIDPALPDENQPEINAYLFFEFELIAMAAGWHEGMSGTAKGTPRPPLCHYP